jgi:hypothetical protein
MSDQLLDAIVAAHAAKVAGQQFVRPASPPKNTEPTREQALANALDAERGARARVEAREAKLEDALRGAREGAEREREAHHQTKRALDRASKRLTKAERELIEVRGVVDSAIAEAEATRREFKGYVGVAGAQLAAMITLTRQLRDATRNRSHEIRHAVRDALPGSLRTWYDTD